MRRPHVDHDSVEERGVHVPSEEAKQNVHSLVYSASTGIPTQQRQLRHCGVGFREEPRHRAHEDR